MKSLERVFKPLRRNYSGEVVTGIQVQYDGKFPSLCGGDLVVTAGGKTYNFPRNCMVPGGTVSIDESGEAHVEEGPWSISMWPDNFPDGLKVDVLAEVNEVVPWGNCGGCV